jgi:hypothetical protein
MSKTYANLKSDVAAWMRRSDLTAVIPSLVALAEQEIFRTHVYPLRVREMETEATLTITSSAATVPSNYVEAKSLRLTDTDTSLLLYRIPERWTSDSDGFFTVVGSEIRVPSSVTSNAKLVYMAQPAALSADSDTSSVLDTYYGLYLSATLKYASTYTKDDGRAQLFQGQLDAYLSVASKRNQPLTAGPLVVRAA